MIETQRLIIKPLSYEQLLKYVKADNSLEIELAVTQNPRSVSPALKEALEASILPNVADVNQNYLYVTLWTAILKEENTLIGDLCFQGSPNEEGAIEIGYGTYNAFRNKGLMREAVSGLIEWAKSQPTVKSIIASTDKKNIASFTILEKNGFTKIGETDTLFNWQLNNQ